MNTNESNPDWVNATHGIQGFSLSDEQLEKIFRDVKIQQSEAIEKAIISVMSTQKEQMHPYKTEAARYRHIVQKYCYRENGDPGCGIDLASQGDPIVPWAWNLELPPDKFAYYNSNNPPHGEIQLFGDATQKFVEDRSLDFVFSSHLLEDFKREDWPRIMTLWKNSLKPGGYLIILVPERGRWQAALKRGQIPNCAHRYEPFLGDVSETGKSIGLEVVEERFTDQSPDDYSILAVLRRPKA